MHSTPPPAGRLLRTRRRTTARRSTRSLEEIRDGRSAVEWYFHHDRRASRHLGPRGGRSGRGVLAAPCGRAAATARAAVCRHPHYAYWLARVVRRRSGRRHARPPRAQHPFTRRSMRETSTRARRRHARGGVARQGGRDHTTRGCRPRSPSVDAEAAAGGDYDSKLEDAEAIRSIVVEGRPPRVDVERCGSSTNRNPRSLAVPSQSATPTSAPAKSSTKRGIPRVRSNAPSRRRHGGSRMSSTLRRLGITKTAIAERGGRRLSSEIGKVRK